MKELLRPINETPLQRLTGMYRVLRHGHPRKSVLAGIATHLIFNHTIPYTENTERSLKFSHLFLCQIDNQGDLENHRSHGRRNFITTGKMYYNNHFLNSNECDFEVDDIEKRIGAWLSKPEINLNSPAVKDWVKANWVWEHLIAGGDEKDIPKSWKKYLQVRNDYLNTGIGDWSWNLRGEDEKNIIYRWTTNWYFARAFAETLGVPENKINKQTDSIWAFVNIYQIATDANHSKNPEEPLYVNSLDIIKKRDPGWSKSKEAMLLAQTVGIQSLLGLAAYGIATSIAKFSKSEDWNPLPDKS